MKRPGLGSGQDSRLWQLMKSMFLLVMATTTEAVGTVMPSGGHPLPTHPPTRLSPAPNSHAPQSNATSQGWRRSAWAAM